MEKSQFLFSLFVGCILIAFGVVIASKASIGLALAAIGAFIAALSVSSWRRSESGQAQAALVPVQSVASE